MQGDEEQRRLKPVMAVASGFRGLHPVAHGRGPPGVAYESIGSAIDPLRVLLYLLGLAPERCLRTRWRPRAASVGELGARGPLSGSRAGHPHVQVPGLLKRNAGSLT